MEIVVMMEIRDTYTPLQIPFARYGKTISWEDFFLEKLAVKRLERPLFVMLMNAIIDSDSINSYQFQVWGLF